MLATLRQRNFVLLWLGGLISQTGDWLLQVGLPVYVYLLTGSALATSILFLISFGPNILLGSVAGVFVDRWDRRRTMLIGNLLMALGLLPLLLMHDKSSLWILYPVLFFEAVASQFIMPAESALIPHLVSEEQLVTANSLNSVGSSVSRLAGGALGGILFGLFGLHTTIWLDLVSFLFVVVMLSLMKLPKQAHAESTAEQPAIEKTASRLPNWRTLGVEWLDGIQLILRQPPLLVLFVMLAAQSLGEGVFSIMLVIFVKLVLNGGSAVYGILLAVQAIGSLLGGLVMGQFGKRVTPARLFSVCTCLFGLIDLLIIDLPLFVKGGVLLVGVLFVLVGIPNAGAQVSKQTLFQILVEDRLRGRVFGAIQAVSALMLLVGIILAGWLGDRLGPVLLLNIQGSVYFLTGVLALLTLGGMRLKRQVMSRESVSA
ncbi:MFS transporter [Ktedonobacter sp. SOSP1-85]|uniref:MFS transporter n=1 Tax=Ktedonobacter sp. SOSP1-85 TaxID=2778367 RepID=UPI0019163404|nr:MFS transporter [Ktedonobacter sp. SOSP1-85]GHO80143.1 MFS transporter [Ktedonobacter sp. SOSP1-85]